MLTFKQFLMEGVVDQIKSTKKLASIIAPEVKGVKTFYDLPGSSVDTLVATPPADSTKLGSYDYRVAPPITKNDRDDFNYIRVYTDNPERLGIPSSIENSTLRHELQHRYQMNQMIQDRPSVSPSDILGSMVSSKYDSLSGATPRLTSALQAVNRGPAISYTLSPQEVNARGIERAGSAMNQHSRLSRSHLLLNPAIDDFALNFEKSGGKLTPPQLDPTIARTQAERALATQMSRENLDLDTIEKDIGSYKKSDATAIAKDLKTARKSIQSDIARGLQSNIPTAHAEVENLFGTKVTSPQRERATRVADTQADVQRSRAQYGGFQTTPFLSDPLSTANMAADMAGALGDVHSRAQTMTKAAASLNNPNFSDSEQMMGDAFLRGGGEEYAVDPRFLQVSNQRAKDRLRDEEWNKKFFHNSFERR